MIKNARVSISFDVLAVDSKGYRIEGLTVQGLTSSEVVHAVRVLMLLAQDGVKGVTGESQPAD